MTDIKPGDYVRQTIEGTVERIQRSDTGPVVHFRTTGGGSRYAPADECVVIERPVRVGDEISYDRAINLPSYSVLTGTVSRSAYLTLGGRLYYGDDEIQPHWTDQTFRVLHIPTEAS